MASGPPPLYKPMDIAGQTVLITGASAVTVAHVDCARDDPVDRADEPRAPLHPHAVRPVRCRSKPDPLLSDRLS